MRIEVLTIFPAMFEAVLGTSILKRAIAGGALTVHVHDLRRWSPDRKHRKVDDRPYGGGPGMVMRPEPFYAAVEALKTKAAKAKGPKPRVILLTPQGQRLGQAAVQRLATHQHLILLCGHYEGVDERVRTLADDELSIGDYVVTGGELPAMVVIDAVARLVPGVLGDATSAVNESFSGPLLEYPQYTRPRVFRRMAVPEILLSGDAKKIDVWRQLAAWKRTRQRRPDLTTKAGDCHGDEQPR